MREEVIIQSITISRRGEQHYFQMKLPRNTHKIIGVETGLYILSASVYLFGTMHGEMNALFRNNLIGRLQLKANGKPDIFYSKEIFERDYNIGAGEIKQFINAAPPMRRLAQDPDGNSFSDFTQWTHGTKREEDPLNICNCTVINGQFRDAIGDYFGMDLQYKVMLYLWIERQIKSNDN